METTKRTIAKTLSWKFFSTLITLAVAFAVQSYSGCSVGHTAIMIAAIDTSIKLFVYFAHERVWTKIHFGRPKNEAPTVNGIVNCVDFPINALVS